MPGSTASNARWPARVCTPSRVWTRRAAARAAGPLVASAVVLERPIKGLADSKFLTEKRREACFDLIMERAVDVSVVVIRRPSATAWVCT